MKKKAGKLDWIIAARGYAMFGVFIGHVIITYMEDRGIDSLDLFGRYLEHMLVPLFAILAGAFFSDNQQTFKHFFQLKFMQRIVPVLFYPFLVLPFIYILPIPELNTLAFFKLLPAYILGIPLINWASWFLVVLFTAELAFFFLQKLAKQDLRYQLLLALCCYSVGWLYNDYLTTAPSPGNLIGIVWLNFSLPLFCALFFIGAACKKTILNMSKWSTAKVGFYAIGCLLLMTPGILLNTFEPVVDGHFRSDFRANFPVISVGQYGNYFFFASSTLFGAAFLLCLSRLIPGTQFFRLCGDQSLILVGLNGIFLSVVNWQLTAWFLPSDQAIWSISYSLVISFLCLAVS